VASGYDGRIGHYGEVGALNLFINQTEYIPSSFVIRYSIIDLPAMP
jgi:hypothetical protein